MHATAAAPSFIAACKLPADLSLAFKAPASVAAVGSFAQRTMVKPSTVVDVAVEIPADTFHPKDQLNYRYIGKRALYLAHLAQQLSSSGTFKQVGGRSCVCWSD